MYCPQLIKVYSKQNRCTLQPCIHWYEVNNLSRINFKVPGLVLEGVLMEHLPCVNIFSSLPPLFAVLFALA